MERGSQYGTSGVVGMISCAAIVMGLVALFPLSASSQESPFMTFDSVMPEPDAPISEARSKARKIFRSVTGVSLPIDHPTLKEMESLLLQNKKQDAIRVATSHPHFYDIKVRDMAKKLGSREETVRSGLNDFVATFVGIVRDSGPRNAKEMLTGNFTYRADPIKTKVNGTPMVRSADESSPDFNEDADFMVKANNHYNDIEKNGFSLFKVLKRKDGQRVIQVTGSSYDTQQYIPIDQPDPAGLLTTRGWITTHGAAGTNRRMVEYAFKQFLCSPITEWSDASSPDNFVSRDVDRMPGGSNNKYQTSCKACHANMDALRNAFAYVESYTDRPVYRGTVVSKINRNKKDFPEGFIPADNSFVNYASTGKNAIQFGWRSPLTGKGMSQFGKMLAESEAFSRCMVRHVFTHVCKRAPTSSDEHLVREIAGEFERTNYNMKELFTKVASRPQCLGI